MKAILNGWGFIRIFRLVLGIIILVQGLVVREPLSIILGLILGGMAIANIGCCGVNGCTVNGSLPTKQTINNEELDFKE